MKTPPNNPGQETAPGTAMQPAMLLLTIILGIAIVPMGIAAAFVALIPIAILAVCGSKPCQAIMVSIVHIKKSWAHRSVTPRPRHA